MNRDSITSKVFEDGGVGFGEGRKGLSPESPGKTLGVIGLGAIGILVANAAVALGMNVIGFDPFMSVGNALKQIGRASCRERV